MDNCWQINNLGNEKIFVVIILNSPNALKLVIFAMKQLGVDCLLRGHVTKA